MRDGTIHMQLILQHTSRLQEADQKPVAISGINGAAATDHGVKLDKKFTGSTFRVLARY